MEFEHKVGGLVDDEDIAPEKEKRNWGGTLIALVVICCIVSAIIVAIFLASPGELYIQRKLCLLSKISAKPSSNKL